MKYRNKIIAAIMLLGFGFSCTDESTYPIDFDLVNNSNGGILSQVDLISVAFDRDDPANSVYSVTLEANDRDRGHLFTDVDLFVRFVDRTPTSANGDGSVAESAVPIATYPASAFAVDATTGLPRLTILITEPAVLTALGIVAADLEGSDQFIFRQAMNFPDGRVFSSNNLNTAIASGGGVYKSPFQNVVSVICASDIGGEINFVTYVTGGGGTVSIAPCQPSFSGVTHWNPLGPGSYDVEDATFGQYDCAWGDNPASGTTLVDACEVLSLGGSDQYGLVYTFDVLSITPDGVTMRLSWENDYGDIGYSDLTRAGGKLWPLGLHF